MLRDPGAGHQREPAEERDLRTPAEAGASGELAERGRGDEGRHERDPTRRCGRSATARRTNRT